MSLVYSTGALMLAAAAVWKATETRRERDGKTFPPGPSSLPLLGVAHKLDVSTPWTTFTEWKVEYGDIIYFRQFGQDVVVLNSEDAVKDLMERRSSNYSDRMYMSTREPYGMDFDNIFHRHDETWRAHRRVAHQGLRERHVDIYQPTQLRFTEALIKSLESSPERYNSHFQRFAASVVLSAIYDHDVIDENDPILKSVVETIDILVLLQMPVNAILFNVFPFLKYTPTWLPGGWRNVTEARVKIERTVNLPFEYLEKKMAAGSAGNSIALEAMERFRDTNKVDNFEKVVKDACCSLYGAASETTSSTLMVFLLAMVQNPDVQKRAQEEIDSILGSGRLPQFSDRQSLPYIEAVCRETLRWRPVAPLGIPHSATNDDVYKGWYIPKDTVVIANVWAISQNPEKYPSPSSFKPERFLDGTGGLTNDVPTYAFGFGRRICPGRHFATNSLWIAVARLLAGFTFESEYVQAGGTVKWHNAVTSVPEPFPCRIIPRKSH
ncbi:cytochrome P450 [Coniophora puteana RWD-64-598 SS2]|uniref:Cytochrome P450 n=1 Tax=Coniophora puteana (strain RWD-64-598) TaxID=741705 RepID=A0A5M3MZ60_CONPW|nr:cytochrome P450 [Coniophora puteana RWD-64-598 SS2]EIW84453.1 cytochrome P450 [Coniophora puteana RWD-64-598 SS2]